MSFHVFTNGSLSNADHVMMNFYHIYDNGGARLPLSVTANSTLAASDNTVDIGSSANRWHNVYANEIIASSLTVTAPYMWSLKAQVILSSSASSVQFTGLNGDNLGEVKLTIEGRTLMAANTLSTDYYMTMYFNTFTAASSEYETRILQSKSGTSSILSKTATGTVINLTNSQSFFCDIRMNLKTGSNRHVISDNSGLSIYVSTSSLLAEKSFSVYKNSTSTITTITINTHRNHIASYMTPGTTIKLMGLN